MRNPNQLFPALELLEDINLIDVPETAISDTLLVGVQHLNETTGSMIEKLISIGFKPYNIHLLGKSYSTNPRSLEKIKSLGCFAESSTYSCVPGSFLKINEDLISKLWARVISYISEHHIKKIILLDDGGRLISSIPENLASFKIVCIEQTTKGIRNKSVIESKFPVISVAQSFSKISFESTVIASAVTIKIQKHISMDTQIGIIGHGNIGKAIFKKLKSLGHKVISYDISDSNLTLEEVVRGSDFLLGCTGYSLDLKKEWFGDKTKYLASCSSEDIEFNKVFEFDFQYSLAATTNNAPNIHFSNHQLILLNSGFPINFDNSKEIEGINGIQVTRGLLYAALLQALTSKNLSRGLNTISFSYEDNIQRYIKKIEFLRNAEAI
jgi:S-adenosylhomocysteine hydrolase